MRRSRTRTEPASEARSACVARSESRQWPRVGAEDLRRSVEFFTKLGYAFDPRFTDDKATSQTFTPEPITDATRATEALVGLSAESRERVDAIVGAALAAGARRAVAQAGVSA